MRIVPLFLCFIAATSAHAAGPQPPPSKPPIHPEEVALADEGEDGFVYRRFPTSQRLYTNDRDHAGASTCTLGCVTAWPPVYAPADAAPVGEWTVVMRSDGKRQWALRGKPVYTRFHDAPDMPTGDGVDGVWHLIPYTRQAASPQLPK